MTYEFNGTAYVSHLLKIKVEADSETEAIDKAYAEIQRNYDDQTKEFYLETNLFDMNLGDEE